ncbi:hypothetical protein SXM_1238 [Shewanella xiamenensis]|jgi:hypothetical protein|nr:hypothetical protein SXM_1238 [Shewanella xiamenensis]
MVAKFPKVLSLPAPKAEQQKTKMLVNKETVMTKSPAYAPAKPQPNPNYPSKTGNPSGLGRGNTPKK